MSRTRTMLLAAAAAGLLAASALYGDDAPDPAVGGETPQSTAAGLPPHLRALQRSMGGSLVEQFEGLGIESTPRLAPARRVEGRRPTIARADAAVFSAAAEAPLLAPNSPVAVLRSTAIELDAAANRLEELQLYTQADALRSVSQRLRVDARQWLARPTPTAGWVAESASADGPDWPASQAPPAPTPEIEIEN